MFDALITLLKSTGIPLAEGAWNNAPQTGSWAAIALDGGAESLWGDDNQQQEAVEGTVDLFCRDNDRGDFRTMKAALKATGISFRLNSIQYETDRRLIHYEWVFQLEQIEEPGELAERFPGLLTYWDDPYISAPTVTVTDENIEITPLGLYVDGDGYLTQRMLEG